MNEEKFTPSQCFQESRKHFVSTAVWTTRFYYYGTKWLFTSYPNFVWPLIVIVIVISSAVTIGQERLINDRLNLTNAVLEDSLNRITMKAVRYTTLSGKPVNPLPPKLPEQEDEE